MVLLIVIGGTSISPLFDPIGGLLERRAAEFAPQVNQMGASLELPPRSPPPTQHPTTPPSLFRRASPLRPGPSRTTATEPDPDSDPRPTPTPPSPLIPTLPSPPSPHPLSLPTPSGLRHCGMGLRSQRPLTPTPDHDPPSTHTLTPNYILPFAQGLAIAAWAFAHNGHAAPKLFDELAKSAVTRLGAFQPQVRFTRIRYPLATPSLHTCALFTPTHRPLFTRALSSRPRTALSSHPPNLHTLFYQPRPTYPLFTLLWVRKLGGASLHRTAGPRLFTPTTGRFEGRRPLMRALLRLCGR